jgi:hypothetical protein
MQTIAEVISGWTGIPVGKMVKDEIRTVLSLEEQLGKRIIGQTQALEAVSQRIRTARARLEDPRRPTAVFLFVGPSGVGKTETALALADLLYGGDRNLVTINMSEYQEAHTVSGLKGSPPGYVGYGEGGVLTEAVRRKPYSVVLLDEVEKAHPDVMELFYQVFDRGQMEDGEGREIDFKNTVILLTTNAETDQMMKLCADPDTAPDPGKLVETTAELNKIFAGPLGRMVIVPLYPTSEKVMKLIITPSSGGRSHRENHGATFSYDERDQRDRGALQGGRKRRPACRPHPDADAPPRDVGGVPRPDGRGTDDLERPHERRRRREFPLRIRLRCLKGGPNVLHADGPTALGHHAAGEGLLHPERLHGTRGDLAPLPVPAPVHRRELEKALLRRPLKSVTVEVTLPDKSKSTNGICNASPRPAVSCTCSTSSPSSGS